MRKMFWMQPAFTPKPDPASEPELREAVAVLCGEVRQLRVELHNLHHETRGHVTMKFSELEGNVGKLIDAAMAVKATAAPVAGLPNLDPDDPRYDALNSRILVALDVLRGPEAVATPPAPLEPAAPPPLAPVDPNAPV